MNISQMSERLISLIILAIIWGGISYINQELGLTILAVLVLLGFLFVVVVLFMSAFGFIRIF